MLRPARSALRPDAVKFIMAATCAEFPLLINGGEVRAGGIAPQTTLLDFLRARGLTGAKEGCAEGECGACAVLLVAGRDGAACYRAVNSCLVPLPAIAGREVVTVEGLAEAGKLNQAQQAMIDCGGSQCGYCTPGFIVSMTAEQYGGHTERDPHSLGGNLCRCTGYRPIAAAFRSLGPPPAGALRNRLAQPVSQAEALHYAHPAGSFSRPATLAECFEILAADPAARLVAGNTDLGIETNLREGRFAHLVSVEALEELRGFTDAPDAVEIGAALTLTEIAERWQAAPPVFHEWLPLFASPPIRNRATLGGNLATASPIGDAAPLLLALDASVVVESAAGGRTVPLDEFFIGYRETALAPGELIRSVIIPKPLPAHIRFYKAAKRRIDDISTVAAAVAITRNGAGVILKSRIAYGGVAAIPLRSKAAERVITAKGENGLAHAQEQLRRTLNPIGDHRGSAAYRLALAQNLLAKGLAA